MKKIYINESAFKRIVAKQLKEEEKNNIQTVTEEQFLEILNNDGIVLNIENVVYDNFLNEISEAAFEDGGFDADYDDSDTPYRYKESDYANIDYYDFLNEERTLSAVLNGTVYGEMHTEKSTYDTPGYSEVKYSSIDIKTAGIRYKNYFLDLKNRTEEMFSKEFEGQTF